MFMLTLPSRMNQIGINMSDFEVDYLTEQHQVKTQCSLMLRFSKNISIIRLCVYAILVGLEIRYCCAF